MTGPLRKLGRAAAPEITELAQEAWEVSPGHIAHVPPAWFLPGQLERIKATESCSMEHQWRVFRGGFDHRQEPTRTCRLNDVDLVGGTLFGLWAQRSCAANRIYCWATASLAKR